MVRRTMGWWLSLWLVAAPLHAQSDDTSCTASLDPPRCSVGDTVTLQVVVTSSTLADAQLDHDTLADLPEGLVEIRRQGPVTSLANDDTTTMRWSVELRALRAGSFTLPAIDVLIEEQGRRLHTPPLSLLVRDREDAPLQFLATGPTHEVYPHEPFDLVLTLVVREDGGVLERLASLRLDRLPLPVPAIRVVSLPEAGLEAQEVSMGSELRAELSGLAQHQDRLYLRPVARTDAAERRFEATVRVALTQAVEDHEWARAWGSLHVGLRTAQGPSVELYLPCPPVLVTLRPIPAVPAGLGPVQGMGHFQLYLDVTPTRVEADQPFWVTLTVTGEGDLEHLQLPDLGRLDQFLHLGREEHRGLRTRRVEYEMQILDPDTYALPPIEWTVFDPEREEFVTHRIASMPLRDVPPPAVPFPWWSWGLGLLLAIAGGVLSVKPMRKLRRSWGMGRGEPVQEPMPETLGDIMTAYDAEELWQALAQSLAEPLQCDPQDVRRRSLLHLMESRGLPAELAVRGDAMQARLERSLYGQASVPLAELKREALELVRAVRQGPVVEPMPEPPRA